MMCFCSTHSHSHIVGVSEKSILNLHSGLTHFEFGSVPSILGEILQNYCTILMKNDTVFQFKIAPDATCYKR